MFDGIPPIRPRSVWDCLLFGGFPQDANSATLRWLRKQHIQRAGIGAPQPLEISPVAHLVEAMRCQHAMRRIEA